MAENVTEKSETCLKCGADIRPGSLFCYSCGSSVSADAGSEIQNNGNLKDNGLPEEKYVSAAGKSAFSDEFGAIEKPIGVPLDSPSVAPLKEAILEGEKKELTVEKETKLKTAASLRRRPKPTVSKTVEVVWDQPESSSHTWFVLVSLILVLFAVCMLMAMLYIR